MHDKTVYDLGDVEDLSAPPIVTIRDNKDAAQAALPHVEQAHTALRTEPAAISFTPRECVPPTESGIDYAASLSLLMPGAGHLLRREWTVGLFFLSSLAFLGTLSWAILETLDRVTETLAILELPRVFGIWALGSLYVCAALLHLWNVLSCSSLGDDREPSHPVLTGIASAVLPGLGQLMNGDTKRAALFVGGLWMIGAAWLLAAPSTLAVLESLNIYLPPALSFFSSAAVRWTLPTVVWSLAVYDATASAAAWR